MFRCCQRTYKTLTVSLTDVKEDCCASTWRRPQPSVREKEAAVTCQLLLLREGTKLSSLGWGPGRPSVAGGGPASRRRTPASRRWAPTTSSGWSASTGPRRGLASRPRRRPRARSRRRDASSRGRRWTGDGGGPRTRPGAWDAAVGGFRFWW